MPFTLDVENTGQ